LRFSPDRASRIAGIFAATLCAASTTAASFSHPASTTERSTGDRIVFREFVPVSDGRLAESGFASGKVLHTADGGQVFGFSIDLSGDDGLLASSQTVAGGNVKSSVETFRQSTATITKVIARTNTMDDFVDLGIFGGDAGLIEHEHVTGFLQVRRTFHVLNPVTGQAFTSAWTPPNRANLLIGQTADDHQTTPEAVIFGTTKSGAPLLFTSDVAANTFGQVFRIDPTLFALNGGPQLAQDVWSGQATFGLSPDGGTVGGSVPDIEMVDLTTGHVKGFQGVRIPPFNSGFINGIAVDAATGIACTTTELDAAVEF